MVNIYTSLLVQGIKSGYSTFHNSTKGTQIIPFYLSLLLKVSVYHRNYQRKAGHSYVMLLVISQLININTYKDMEC